MKLMLWPHWQCKSAKLPAIFCSMSNGGFVAAAPALIKNQNRFDLPSRCKRGRFPASTSFRPAFCR